MISPLFMLFCASSLIAVFTPGPAVMLALQNSTQYGWRRTILSSLGNISGLLVLVSASAIGLGALLRSSASLFLLLKLIGAGYLIYLGIKQWRSGATAQRRRHGDAERSKFSLYREGLLLALSNPKAILFITALFPQFILSSQPLLPQLALMTITFMTLSFCALMTYAIVGHLARGGFVATIESRGFRRASGGLFVLMGIGLLGLKPR